MVIECIGLPGSGKRELIGLVEKELKRREVDYVNVSEGLRRRICWKFLRAIAGALIYLSADARWLRGRLLGILAGEGEDISPGIYRNDKAVIRSLVLYAYCCRRMARSHRLYLFDEGMVHTLTLFCADRRVSGQSYRKMVLALEKGIRRARLVVFNEISAEESLAAIEGGDRRYEVFNRQAEREKCASLLEEYESLLETYRTSFRVLEVRRQDGDRRNLSRIFARIRQILSDAGE